MNRKKGYIIFVPFFLIQLVLICRQGHAQTTHPHVKGRVLDLAGNALPQISVSLVNAADSQHIRHTLTTPDGHFRIPLPQQGTFRLHITAIGYQPWWSNPFPAENNNLDTIRLETAVSALSAFTVKGRKPLITQEAGKLTLNISNSINAQGSSAFELLQKTPGVAISRNNDIALNGKGGVRVLIDDKPLYLETADLIALLKGMTATSIRSIEIIHQPGAQYDAAGSAGIINIRTIRNKQYGYNGNIAAGVAYGYTFKQNTDFNFNYRKRQLNLYGNYSHLFGHYGYRYNLDRKIDGQQYYSSTIDTDKRNKVNATLGLDYQLDERQTIGVILGGNFRFGPGITNTETRIMSRNHQFVEQILTAGNDYYHQGNARYTTSVNYKWEDTTGHLLNFDADYGYFDGSAKNLQPNTYSNAQTGEVTSSNLYRTLNGTGINLYALKADYHTPWWKGKLQSGVKWSSVRSANDFNFYHVTPTSEVEDAQRSNAFTYREQVWSAYTQYDRLVGKIRLQAGVRVENTLSKGILRFKGNNNSSRQEQVNNNYFSVFPSAAATYTPNEQHSFSLSYSRRIDRPAYQYLNPFVYLLDELSFWQGNPFLQPQFANRFTAEYGYKGQTFITLAYTRTSDFSALVTDTLETNKIVMIPRNLGLQHHISLSITHTQKLFTWWQLSVNGLAYYVKNKMAFDQYRAFNLNATAWTLNLQQTFQLPLKLEAELGALYNSPALIGANERIKANGQIDIGLQKKIIGDKGALKFSVTDLFLTNRWNIISGFNDFTVHSYGRGESRQVRASFSYRFGSNTIKAHRERQQALDNETERIK